MNVEPTILVVSAGDPDERLIAALQQHGLYVERIRLDSFSGMYPLVAPDLVLCFGARESSTVLRAMVEAELAAPSRLAIVADPGQVALTQGLNRRLVVAVLTTDVPAGTVAARLASIAFRLSERRATETRTRAKAGHAQVVRERLAIGASPTESAEGDRHALPSKLKALGGLTQSGGRLGPSSLRAPEPDLTGLVGSGGFRPRPPDRTRWLRGGKARRAVVADVNPERAAAIADALTERGLDVQVVPLDPSKTDWARLQAHEPDVVLVDLPSVEGPARVWLELLRADAQLGQVRIVQLNLERVYDDVDDQVSLAALEPYIEELSSYRSEMPTIVAEDERPTLHMEEEERPTLVREESALALERSAYGFGQRVDEMPTVAHIDLSDLAGPSTIPGAGPPRSPYEEGRGGPTRPGSFAPDGPPRVQLSESVAFESRPSGGQVQGRAEQGRAGPSRVEPSRAEQGRAGSSRAEQGRGVARSVPRTAELAPEPLPPQPVSVAFPPVRAPRPGSSWPPPPSQSEPPPSANPGRAPGPTLGASPWGTTSPGDPWSDPPSGSPATLTGLEPPRRSERSPRTISSWPPPPAAGSTPPVSPLGRGPDVEVPPPIAGAGSARWPNVTSPPNSPASSVVPVAPASVPAVAGPGLPLAPPRGVPQGALPASAMGTANRAAALSVEPERTGLSGLLKFLLALVPVLALAAFFLAHLAPHRVTQLLQQWGLQHASIQPLRVPSHVPSDAPSASAPLGPAPVVGPKPTAPPLANPWTIPAHDALACEQVAELPSEVTGATIERGSLSWERARRILMLGDVAAAHRHMCEAVFNNPQSLALEGLVAHYLALHAAPQALRWAERAIAVRGDGRKAGELHGDALSQLGRVEEARRAWLGALKIADGDQKTATLVSVSYVGEAERSLLSADLARAESMARRAAGLDEASAPAAAMMASVFIAQGFEEQGQLWIARSERLDPSDAGCLIARGELLEATGRPGEARDLYRRVTQIAPGNKRGWLRLSRLPAESPGLH